MQALDFLDETSSRPTVPTYFPFVSSRRLLTWSLVETPKGFVYLGDGNKSS